MRAVIQSADYYPYGEPWREPSGQPFLYGGKERLRVYGLNEYDFKARRLIPALGIFTVFDDAAEKNPEMSPYLYCSGNPVNRIDPTGMTDFEVEDKIKTINDIYHNIKMRITPEEYERLLIAFNNGSSDYETILTDIAKRYSEFSLYLDKKSTSGLGIKLTQFFPYGKLYHTIKDFSVGASALGVGIGAESELIEMASKEPFKGNPNQSLKGTDAVRATNGNATARYFKIVKSIDYASFAATIVNSLNTCHHYYNNHGSGAGVATKAILDVAMSAIGTFGGPPGLAISTTYFILDVATDGFGVHGQ